MQIYIYSNYSIYGTHDEGEASESVRERERDEASNETGP